MKNLFLRLLLGILSFICILAIAPIPVASASSMPQAQLSEAIDHFLTSLPSDYYTIANTEALKNIIKNDNAAFNAELIDVRQPSEYNSGHIPNAINIPLQTLIANLDKIPQDRPVVLYCTTGYRSAMGVMTLQILGRTNVHGFPLSIQGWKAAGKPLQK
ncbi:rhodanese-like domain-containing protein [Nostoc sp. 'Peltigera membranacea cyanobiont' N6]|uniref:rhodanese-like domain-containing protein n=1 Tax=Nostoc sp. 'Peltigera membranacea cyanobiont' N6 TaxID=1261031 RepID=UPI000CF31A53|nr:rhodanese-like domain-containing protein [Nostoc sp. 'Peltigera membranacea cyanobiont' N6]AVH64207.1 rhodanese-related sulfurtransferase [Nostoc sp. 'Peltigera membranacea cyanobiont' N6]